MSKTSQEYLKNQEPEDKTDKLQKTVCSRWYRPPESILTDG